MSGENKPFNFEERINEVAEAKRFGLTRQDVKETIANIQGSPTISISVTKRKEELQQYLRALYDELAREYSYESYAHMLATLHVDLTARGIVFPGRFDKEALKAAAEASKLLYPPEKATIKRTLPPGDTKEAVLKRLTQHLTQHLALAPEEDKHNN